MANMATIVKIRRKTRKRGEEESESLRELLERQRGRISKAADEFDPNQLALPGIAEEDQKHIFEPFFTTKPVGSGTGLGLDIARRIVESKHGGEIALATSPNGTEFTVYLPVNGSSHGGVEQVTAEGTQALSSK